ncbi:MAG: RNase adapter RapZ [Oscillospiraceae bacterium]
MEFLIITGLSGAGKTRAADICEDLNYYCVDNLPVDLLPQFADLCRAAQGRYEKAAVVMDVRSVPQPDKLGDMLKGFLTLEGTVRILYLEADMNAIVRRYKESRRPHPLGEPGLGIERAVEKEAALLAPFRERADLIINTTGLSLNQLKNRIVALLEPDEKPFSVHITSFGYKLGIPQEADLVFDVRCLANPYYQDSLRRLNGLDPAVSEYVFRDGTASELTERLRSLVEFLVPLFERDRQELNIAVGCTGGHHRSVAVAQALGDMLERPGLAVSVSHRDMER